MKLESSGSCQRAAIILESMAGEKWDGIRLQCVATSLAESRTLEYMDVPHSLFKCNFSAGTMRVNVKYSPCPWSLAKIFGYSVIGPQYTLAR